MSLLFWPIRRRASPEHPGSPVSLQLYTDLTRSHAHVQHPVDHATDSPRIRSLFTMHLFTDTLHFPPCGDRQQSTITLRPPASGAVRESRFTTQKNGLDLAFAEVLVTPDAMGQRVGAHPPESSKALQNVPPACEPSLTSPGACVLKT